MLRFVALCAALSSISSLYSQQTGISGPVEGFTFDSPTRTIRAVTGSLGSASLSAPIVSLLDFASVAPGQNYGIAVRDERTLLVSALGSAQPSVTALPGISFTPDAAAWSGDGTAAILYSRKTGWVQMFTGFPESVSGASPVSIAVLGGTLAIAAVDIHGHTLAIGIAGANAGVYGLKADSNSFYPLLQASKPVSLAFSGDGSALYTLDASNGQISEIVLSNLASQTIPLNLPDAIAIWPSASSTNGNILYVAGTSGPSLVVYDCANQQTIANQSLSFKPTTIEPLSAGAYILRSRSSDDDPLWSFTDRGQTAIYFVPAPMDLLELRRRGSPR